MTDLSGFYFDQYALNFLTQFILALVMTVYLWRVRPKTEVTWLTISLFAAITIYAGMGLWGATAVWSRYFFASYGQLLAISVIWIIVTQFSHRFPQIPEEDALPPKTKLVRQRNERVVFFVFTLVTVLALIDTLYQFGQLRPGGNPQFHNLLIVTWFVISAVITVFTFWRRSYTLSAFHQPEHPWWKHLFNPPYPPARQPFAYVTTGIIPISLTTIGFLATALGAPIWVFNALLSIGVLVAMFTFWILYFNYTSEQTTFMARLVGITLVTVFLILGLTGHMLAPAYKDNIRSEPIIIQPQTLVFVPQTAGGYEVASDIIQLEDDWGERVIDDSVELPFDIPFYGQSRSQISLPVAGILSFGGWSEIGYQYNFQPAITAVTYENQQSTVETYVNASPERVIVTWQMLSPVTNVMQVVLWPDGRFHLTYQYTESNEIARMGIQSGNGGTNFQSFTPTEFNQPTAVTGDGLLTDYTILYRQSLHTFMLPLVYLLIFASLIIVVGLPFFFQSILIKPLDNLVAGVRAVEQGDLQWQVPVQNKDEIGLVSHAFNRMVTAVYQSEQNLEAQVVKRTQELTESEQRFRGLAQATYEVIIIHEQGQILDVNETVTNLFLVLTDFV